MPRAMSGYHSNQKTSANVGYGTTAVPSYATLHPMLPMLHSSIAAPKANQAPRVLGS